VAKRRQLHRRERFGVGIDQAGLSSIVKCLTWART
jgi:hypothetical protein